MAAMMSSSSAVVGLASVSRIGGQSLRSAARMPAVVRVAGLIVKARQGNADACSSSAVEAAVSSVFGEKNTLKMQGAAIIAMNALIAMPVFAEEEKGKIFDFNLTLPIIAVQFLLLMVALDNVWFKPVAKVMDARDEDIRSKLVGVRDNSSEINALQSEAESLIRAARAETAGALAKVKRETAAELDAKLQEYRSRIEKELEASLANLEKQKAETLKGLDSQVEALSSEILQKVVPFKF